MRLYLVLLILLAQVLGVECRDPSVSPGLNASTMPIELKNTAANAFTIQTIKDVADPTQSGYVGRLVGDYRQTLLLALLVQN